MRSVLRDFTFVTGLVVVALMLALVWRDPFVSAHPRSAHAQLQAEPELANQ
jgi:hypothetical protein